MSAAKMVADSTQSDTDSRKKRNRSAGRRGKKSRKDRRRRRYSSSSTDSRHTRSGSDSATDDYDSDIDLQKELKPLSAYLRSPKDLVDQMLHSVRGSSLQRALPDVLKDMPMDELRKRCLQHLEVMSRKRMRRILSGDDPAAISSSGTEEDDDSNDGEKAPGGDGDKVDSTAEEGKESKETAAKGDGGPADSPLSIAADDTDDQALEEGGGQHVEPAAAQARMEGVQEEEREEQEEGEAEAEEEEEDWDLEGAGDDMADVLFPEVEQDKMELLELEMRARAIKAMLALHEQREKEQKRRVRKR